MNECFGKKFILNGELLQSGSFDNSLVYEGDSIYEVIRMVRGNPVFFNDHMERLSTSLRLMSRKQLIDIQGIKKDIIKLCRSDKKKETNLKIVFNYNKESTNYLIYFIEPIYPSDNQYRVGVKGILFFAERRDPESKVINHRLRSSIYHKLILESAYEALLVNKNSCVTEGSRSNIFFLKDNSLFTAPDNVILNGITRKHILEICNENNIKVSFISVNSDTISEYDAVFMTGTSPAVLPFCCIDDHSFKVNFQLISELRQLYFQRAEESISLFRI